jgi:hypothetical protein
MENQKKYTPIISNVWFMMFCATFNNISVLSW